MDPRAQQIRSDCEEKFNALYQQYKSSDFEILLSYFGGLDQSLTFILSNKVEQILEDHESSRSVIKRIFSILIESLQNIRHHAFRSILDEELAGIVVARSDKAYEINVMNLADENARLILENRIADINKLTLDELKQHYLETMTNGIISDKGGAGLGIITIAMKSREPILAHFHKLSSGLYLVNIRFRIAVES
jgi:hypothetical protein